MKTKKLLAAVEDGTQTAVEYLTPYVEQALREGGEFADATYTKLRPVLNDARVRGARVAADTFEKVHPSIDDALDRVSPAVEAGVRKVRPAVEEALTQIPPTVDFARSKVQDEFLKNLSKTLAKAASQPLSTEVKAAVATAALAKQLSNTIAPKKRSGWRTFGKILLAGALLGGVVAAIKKLLADPSTGWETHSPRSSYVADPVNPAEEAKTKVSAFASKAKDVAEDVEDKVKDAADEVVDKAKDVADDLSDQAADVADKVEDAKDAAKDVAEDVEDKLARLADETDSAEGDDASPLAGSPYGEGSYVGDEPPEGYVIKGNDRSMKYHLPGSAAYERTIAEVWFASEEAAEAAGFVRAQR